MADTRVANPAYHVEVDQMILEYLLYHAIKSSLEQYAVGLNGHDFEVDDNSVKDGGRHDEDAPRLLTSFDDFMKLFRHNHSKHRFTKIQDFNLQILEFLVLFAATSSAEHSLSTKTLRSLKARCKRHSRLRRTWLRRRPTSNPKESKTNDLSAWRGWQYDTATRSDGHLVHDHPARVSISQLLPNFLDISTTASKLRGESPNEYWMDLAAEYMLQSAVERLSGPRPRLGGDQLDDDDENAEAIIRACFAYGVVWSYSVQSDAMGKPHIDEDHNSLPNNSNRIFDNDRLENRLDYIFGAEEEVDSPGSRSDDEDENDNDIEDRVPVAYKDKSVLLRIMDIGSPEFKESPIWTRTRLRYLHLFQPKSASSTINTHSTDPARIEATLSDIVDAHPLPRFRQKVIRFIESLWRDLGSGNDKTRPLLVSIEDGDYRGLGLDGKEEFEKLMRRSWVC